MSNQWTLLVLLSVVKLVDFSNGFALPNPGYVEDWSDRYRLDIVHYNDFHARFEETSKALPICRTNDTSCLGGFPRLYYEIKTLLAAKPKALLLNAGDNFQGTYWYALLKWNVTQEFLNMLPHDAYAIGNHEFDDGVDGLAPFLKSLKAPVLAANMDTSKAPELQNLYQPNTILTRNGRRIGIIGLITPQTKIGSSAGAVEFEECGPVAQREARALVKRGVDIIVVLSHCGLDVDKDTAQNYGEDIDIIVGGHSHSLLWNGPSPDGEIVNDSYPVIIQPFSNTQHKVVIVQASAYTKVVGNLSVWFDKNGDYLSWEGTPVFLNRSIPEDENIKKLLVPYSDHLHSLVNEVIALNEVDMDSYQCAKEECVLGDFIADAFNNFTKSNVPSKFPYVAFIHKGTIRDAIRKGPVTRGDVLNTVPFYNKLVTFLLQGKYIKEALETGTTNSYSNATFATPNLLHVSGMRVELNITKPVGERVMSVVVKEGDEWRPLDMEGLYQVSTLNFLAKGLGGFKILAENKQEQRMIGYDRDVLEAYFRQTSPWRGSKDGRLLLVK